MGPDQNHTYALSTAAIVQTTILQYFCLSFITKVYPCSLPDILVENMIHATVRIIFRTTGSVNMAANLSVGVES
jgi:hypothetical protein